MRIAYLSKAALGRADPSPDDRFYAAPRMVAHIDERAIAALRAIYAEHLSEGDAVLDLMSSRYSHLPDLALDVTGHGMNEAELAANPALARCFVQDLNADPALQLETGAFDAALCCVSVQYLVRPVAVFAEVARVLRPGGVFMVSFSNRCFPTKAVAVWHALSGPERARYVAMALDEAGLIGVEAVEALPEDGRGDPLWAVTGTAP